jgi:hypothetical protein
VDDIPFYEERYTGFSMKITNSDHPQTVDEPFVTIVQWFQDNEVGDVMGLRFIEDSFKVELYVKDENLSLVHVANYPMETEKWVDFVFGYRFDPSGVCDSVTWWANGSLVGEPYSGKIGLPESWGGEDIRQYILWHRFGIYRSIQNGTLNLLFDEVKHGFNYQQVATPPVKITNENVVASFDPSTHTWDATITFDTHTIASATVLYDPVSDCYAPCSFSQSEPEAGGPTTHHTVICTNLVAPQYCYRIEASEPAGGPVTYIDGSFELDNGYDEIYDIVHTWNETRCKVNVEWRTKYPSKNNKLFYRRQGTTTWEVASPRQSDCDPARFYSTGFPVTAQPEFYISTYINGVRYVSDIMQRSENCEEPIIQTVDEGEKQQQTVTVPFVRSRPNPFNPSTTISFGVPSPSHVELNIYDAAGRHISKMVSGRREAGVHTITWDGTNSEGAKVTSGVYFARLIVGETVLTSKLVLLK